MKKFQIMQLHSDYYFTIGYLTNKYIARRLTIFRLKRKAEMNARHNERVQSYLELPIEAKST